MMINISKSEVLSIPDLSPYKTVKETKILGVLFYTSQNVENIELLLSSQIQKHRGLISLSKSLRAKSLTLSVYVLPKFFDLARHTSVNLDTVSKCQDVTFDQNGGNAASAEFGILAASLPNWRFRTDKDVI